MGFYMKGIWMEKKSSFVQNVICSIIILIIIGVVLYAKKDLKLR